MDWRVRLRGGAGGVSDRMGSEPGGVDAGERGAARSRGRRVRRCSTDRRVRRRGLHADKILSTRYSKSRSQSRLAIRN